MSSLFFDKSLPARVLEPKESQQQLVIHHFQEQSTPTPEADFTPAFSLHKCNQTLSSRRLAMAAPGNLGIVSPNRSVRSIDSYMTFVPEVLF